MPTFFVNLATFHSKYLLFYVKLLTFLLKMANFSNFCLKSHLKMPKMFSNYQHVFPKCQLFLLKMSTFCMKIPKKILNAKLLLEFLNFFGVFRFFVEIWKVQNIFKKSKKMMKKSKFWLFKNQNCMIIWW